MADMIKLFVNGEEVEVESGKNLIDAVGAAGIEIPHLCYHPALGADGNCRMCLVGIEDGRPPIVPACKTPAAEGMKVQLDTDVIKKIQRDVMEFELINHPIDCPVCDQAGECALQDYYMTYDGQESRMRVDQVKKGKKMDFGGGVVHDQERCILCGRCVRFCRQITKTGELGIVNRTDYARVAIFPGRPINNRYGLNVVDLCPVGAMTSSDFRFKQRVWFLTKSESICHGCSKGCNIYIDHNREKYKDDVIYRFRPRFNEGVNGYFMCDEGRLSYKEENDNRLQTGLKNGREIAVDEATQLASSKLKSASKVVVLLSPNLTVEQMAATLLMAEKNGYGVSGYSDFMMKEGSGDEYLIQDDKSANRAAFAHLGIDSDKEEFLKLLEESDLLLSVGSSFSDRSERSMKKALGENFVVTLATHSTGIAEEADIAIPITSFSEYSGSIINCDGYLQSFEKAVVRDKPAAEVTEVLQQLGDIEASRQEILARIAQCEGELGKVNFDQIPPEGMKLR